MLHNWRHNVQLCYFPHTMERRAKSLNSWVDEIQRMGRYTFTREEATRELTLCSDALDKVMGSRLAFLH